MANETYPWSGHFTDLAAPEQLAVAQLVVRGKAGRVEAPAATPAGVLSKSHSKRHSIERASVSFSRARQRRNGFSSNAKVESPVS